MTPSSINIAIAELLGLPMGTRMCSGGSYDLAIPNFHGDLNAIHEAEKQLTTNSLRGEYEAYLDRITGIPFKFPFNLIHATAPQRCEAFLKTRGKWIEETV